MKNEPPSRLKIKWKSAALAAILIVAATYVLTLIMPDYSGQPCMGIFSVIPAAFLIVYICLTKRIFESLILASFMGFMMAGPKECLSSFTTSLQDVMMSSDIAWLILVCGLMGSIIALVDKAGGAMAFGEWVAKKAKTKNAVHFWTWVLGIVIFLDDYLNALVIGSCMAPLSDKHKSPREFLAFIVDSTAAPACVLIPISTWGVFVGGLLEINGWAPEGEGLRYFIQTIPFNFYAWVGILIVPLFIFNIIKPFGPMKKAEERVKAGGPICPPGSEKIDMRGGKESTIVENPRIINFFLPIGCLIFFTILFDVDMAMGVYCTLAVMFVFYLGQGIMTGDEFWDTFLIGLKNMINSLILMVLAFLFAEASSRIGFTYYMIHTAEKFMTPELLPLIVFIVLSITEFVTGTNWGMYIIALPIVIPLAMDLGVNVPLAVSAVISAGVFGSHICFYSDATVVTSAATGCDNFAHAKTQMLYGLLAAGITMVLYLIAGFIF